jgi:hypothetical protein
MGNVTLSESLYFEQNEQLGRNGASKGIDKNFPQEGEAVTCDNDLL